MRKWYWVLLAVFALGAPVQGQLVVVDSEYQVQRVDRDEHQFVVSPPNPHESIDDKPGQFDVEIAPKTVVVNTAGRPVNWRSLQPGMFVHIKGGLRLDMRITADKVVIEQ